MSGFFKFASIYKTTIIQNPPLKIILDPVRIEIFKGSREYLIPLQTSKIIPENENSMFTTSTKLMLEPDYVYIEIIARTKESDPYLAKDFCESEIDKIVALFSIIYGPNIFDSLEYRGWLLETDKGIMEAWVKVSDKFNMDADDTDTQITQLIKDMAKDPDLWSRFILMSKFYSRALPYFPSPEKFIFLWTILEIFPMKNSTHIKPILDYLNPILLQPPDIIKANLNIGKLYGIRTDIVHYGKFDIDNKVIGQTFTQLEEVVLTILRNMAGLTYDKSLDKYFV